MAQHAPESLDDDPEERAVIQEWNEEGGTA